MNYKKDIEIDADALDIEWLGQASKMMQYTKYSALKRRLLEEAKQNLDVSKAEADKKIRTNPEKFGIEKITETVVANAILNESGYKQAYTEYLEAKYEADMAQGAVNAFEHRKSALENLVRLFGQQYFAGPNMPRNLHEEVEKRKALQEELNLKIGRTMQRKNRKENTDEDND